MLVCLFHPDIFIYFIFFNLRSTYLILIESILLGLKAVSHPGWSVRNSLLRVRFSSSEAKALLGSRQWRSLIQI